MGVVHERTVRTGEIAVRDAGGQLRLVDEFTTRARTQFADHTFSEWVARSTRYECEGKFCSAGDNGMFLVIATGEVLKVV